MNTQDARPAWFTGFGFERQPSLAIEDFGAGARQFILAALLIACLCLEGMAQSNESDLSRHQAAIEYPSSPILKNVFLPLDGAPAMGDANARVAIVEFGDYQCPYSIMHANQALPQIVTEYVNSGKVRYFFKDLPVEAIHPQAFREAEAAHCAGDQGNYWGMHDRLLRNPQPQVLDELPAYALLLDLDVPKFQQCMRDGTYAGDVRNGLAEARRFHVQGTPTFFLGMLDTQGSELNAVTKLYGAQPYSAFKQALDQILSLSREAEGTRE